MSNKTYGILKYTALIFLPALATLYNVVAGIWNIPYTTQIVGTLTALDTFIGTLLGLSLVNKATKEDVHE